jgi:hypothetical protein
MTKLLEQTLSKICLLPDNKQDALAQMLVRELAQLEQLGRMTADPNIQREIRAISEEFAVTELDRLTKARASST